LGLLVVTYCFTFVRTSGWIETVALVLPVVVVVVVVDV
jgi:hypothetical protein